jgi:hypothetical protein
MLIGMNNIAAIGIDKIGNFGDQPLLVRTGDQQGRGGWIEAGQGR